MSSKLWYNFAIITHLYSQIIDGINFHLVSSTDSDSNVCKLLFSDTSECGHQKCKTLSWGRDSSGEECFCTVMFVCLCNLGVDKSNQLSFCHI